MEFVLDVTRLIQRRDAAAPTGIDRVALSYALFLAGRNERSTHFVYQAGGRLHAIERELVLPFLLGLDAQWQGGAPAPRAAAHCKKAVVDRFNSSFRQIIDWRLNADPKTLVGNFDRAMHETGANFVECLHIDFRKDFGGKFAWTERWFRGWPAWFAKRGIASVNAPIVAGTRLGERLRRRRNEDSEETVSERNALLHGTCLSVSAMKLFDRLRKAELPSVYLNVSHTGIEVPDTFEAVRTYGYQTEILFYVHDLIPITHPEYVPEGDMARHESRMTTVTTLSERVLVNSLDTANALAAFAHAKALPSPRATVLHIGVEPFGAAEFRRVGGDDRAILAQAARKKPKKKKAKEAGEGNGAQRAGAKIETIAIAALPVPAASTIVPLVGGGDEASRGGMRFSVDSRGSSTISLASLAFERNGVRANGSESHGSGNGFSPNRVAASETEARKTNGVYTNGAPPSLGAGNANGYSFVPLSPKFRKLKDVPLDGGGVFRMADPCFVVIGTIEPRKNHLLLLNLWRDFLAEFGVERTPHLYVIGKRGWENENVVDMLERTPNLSFVVSELKDVSDVKMNAILRGCRALLFPSFTEGWGMPLAEALAAGVPAICSDIPVLHEAGQEIPDYVHPLDAMRWRSLILDYASEESIRRPAQIERIASYKSPNWRDHFDKLSELFSV